MKKLLPILFVIALFGRISAQTCAFTYFASPSGAVTLYADSNFNPSTTNYVWTFSNGLTASGYSPTVTLPNGVYNVCVDYVNGALGNTICSYCDSVVVGNGGGTTCNFMVMTTPNSLLVDFNVTVPSGQAAQWSFGDGSSGMGSTPWHNYSASGNYQVCVQLFDTMTQAVTCTSCQTVSVQSTSNNCYFSAFPDSMNPSMYYFSASPAYPGSTISWSFGDSTNGSGMFTSHTYAASGVYQVCMIESDSNGVNLCNHCMNVNVTSGVSCAITGVNLQGPTYSFSIPNPGFASSILWDFGDGSTGTGNNVIHSYNAPGVYIVTVTVTGQGMVLCTSVYTVVISNPTPTCSSYFMSSVQALDAYFVDLSTGTSPATSYSWDFGDGSPVSTLRFPQHTYAVPGMYNVCLTINDGSCTDTYCAMVQADTSVIVNPGCQAFFATVQLAPYQLAVVNFSSGMNLSFTWDFGDGSTSNQAYPSHQYASTGSYNLCLTVADNNGCSDTYCDTISVDSMGYIFRSLPGFTISVVSPAALAAGINDDIQPLRFTAYPNPVSNMSTIERDANAFGTASYRIYTLQGAAVMSGNLEAATTTIQLGQLANGAYLLEVMESNGFRSFRNLIKY